MRWSPPSVLTPFWSGRYKNPSNRQEWTHLTWKGVSILMQLSKYTLRKLELALLVGLAISLLAGTWLTGEQRALSASLVRLHVIGATDSQEDQAAKLLARDAVLNAATPLLEGVADQREAMSVLGAHLEELAQAAAAASGMDAAATVEGSAWFPTKEYEDFSLPAGRYPALKITLGAGEGHNWWCVVFPPLCTDAVVEVTAGEVGDLTGDQIRLITGESGSYVVKFKAMELWNRFTDRASTDR